MIFYPVADCDQTLILYIQPEQRVLKTHFTLSPTFLTESPQPTLSPSQILSMFPTQPLGGSPYSSPPYSPTAAMPWGQSSPLGNQWGRPAVAPWPTMHHGSMAAWAPSGITAPPAGGRTEAHGVVTSQPGVMWGGNTPTSPTTINGYPTPLNSVHAPSGTTGVQQSAPPSLNNDLLL